MTRVKIHLPFSLALSLTHSFSSKDTPPIFLSHLISSDFVSVFNTERSLSGARGVDTHSQTHTHSCTRRPVRRGFFVRIVSRVVWSASVSTQTHLFMWFVCVDCLCVCSGIQLCNPIVHNAISEPIQKAIFKESTRKFAAPENDCITKQDKGCVQSFPFLLHRVL